MLPATVAWAESFADPPDAMLFAEEETVVSRAVDKRRREFTTVRQCARRALADLGIAPVPILPGEKGEPRWPEGIVGTMTHCAGYRAAAVAPTEVVATIGIDAEPHEPLPEGLLHTVSLSRERVHLDELSRSYPDTAWDRLLFCAKEATYKAWFPVMRGWLDFQEAEIVFDPAARTFASRLLVPGPLVGDGRLQTFPGRWVVDGTIAATAITVGRR